MENWKTGKTATVEMRLSKPITQDQVNSLLNASIYWPEMSEHLTMISDAMTIVNRYQARTIGTVAVGRSTVGKRARQEALAVLHLKTHLIGWGTDQIVQILSYRGLIDMDSWEIDLQQVAEYTLRNAMTSFRRSRKKQAALDRSHSELID